MKNIYYLIWADSIQRIKKYHPEKTDWKVTVFILNTWVNALSVWMICLWLKFFNILTIPLIKIDIFPGRLLNSFFAFTIEFALPFGILNYFLIFHKNRYKKIVAKYSLTKKKYAFIYSTIVALSAFISAVLYWILR